MRALRTAAVTVTTDAAGDGIGYSESINGRVLSVRYVKTNFDNNVTLAVTTEGTGESALALAAGQMDASVIKYPRVQVHDAADGAALTLDGTRKNVEPLVVVNERLKFTVASGGNTKSGTFYVTYG